MIFGGNIEDTSECVKLLSSVFPDKSYSIEDVTIRSVIHMDGTVDIEESRSYQFNGKFSWVEYVLPKRVL